MALPAGTTVINGFALTPDGALYVTIDPAATFTATTITASTRFLAGDGAVGAPSYSWTNFPTAGLIAGGGSPTVVVAGAAVARWTATNYIPSVDGTIDLGASGNHWKRLYLDYTNTGTVGAVTISKASGRVNIAAAGTSVVVTNTLVTAASHVMAVMSTADATGRVTSVVPAAGSFTINTVSLTAQASFDFLVINAD